MAGGGIVVRRAHGESLIERGGLILVAVNEEIQPREKIDAGVRGQLFQSVLELLMLLR